jgi:hypothetical protein
MARWQVLAALGLPLAAGCLLADVGIDESLGEQGGSAGSMSTGVGSLQGASGASSGSMDLASAPNSNGVICERNAPDIASYEPNREQACLDYCNLYTCICAGHPGNSYNDTFDCLDKCIDSGWAIGRLASVEPGSITCRFWHAGLAVTQGLTPHCYHAAEVPSQGGCQVVP